MTFLIPAALVRRFTQTAKPSRTFHVHQLPPNRFRGIASTAYVKSSNKENGEPIDLKREIERIGDMFTVARDELEYAEEAKGTTYYNEDKQTAQQVLLM
ncbi:hypothetical protein DFS34DRAFT_600677 [Phlyctochytrium arcticum]|nr:hypothetical protein DFS34DRAFT_600677 [Phlyctochytrium arcticum]